MNTKGVISGLIEIGDIPVSITFANLNLYKFFSNRYRNFIAAKLPKYHIFIEELTKIDNKSDKLLTKCSGDKIQFFTNFYYGLFDITKNTIKVKVFFHPITFDNFIRTVFGMISIQENCLMLHGMAYVYDDKAFFISGEWLDIRQPISRKIQKKDLLSDSMILVKYDHDGFNAYSTPFNSDMTNITFNRHAPLKHMAFSTLSSDRTHGKAITKKQALMRTLSLGYFIPCHKESSEKYLLLAEKLIYSVKSNEMSINVNKFHFHGISSDP